MMVLDGGDCAVGIESSIVDCSRERPVLLRPGVIPRSRLEAALGEPLMDRDAAAPRVSGDMAAHYAPQAKVRLFDAQGLRAALHPPATLPQGLAVYSRTRAEEGAAAGLRWRLLPEEPALAARELFAVLRDWDAAGVREIWIEQPPDTAEWEGVRDRLRRAAAA
jgi:L-threonylcarbamoyladenylate synthase